MRTLIITGLILFSSVALANTAKTLPPSPPMGGMVAPAPQYSYPQASSMYYGGQQAGYYQQPPVATYSYTPQPAYEETEVYVPVIRYEKRKAFKPVGAVMPGQLPTIQSHPVGAMPPQYPAYR
ncbi:hypothetical protein [Chrysiogenes arsenatis]|uniref:hypothetical protein n=1 Tax=Chrysiogenes arsenatis TaxID=309797 RepID=UPI000406D4BF|nr:hypothetical protein [Chrysiogenes arsenatis]